MRIPLPTALPIRRRFREHNDCHLSASGRFGAKGDPECGGADGGTPESAGLRGDDVDIESAVYEWEKDEYTDYPEGRGAQDVPELLSRFGIDVERTVTSASDADTTIHTLRRGEADRYDPDSNLYVLEGGTLTRADRWINDLSSDEAELWVTSGEDFNKDFWEFPGMLYHATPAENAEAIDREGLGPRNKTRGLSNRSVGGAVFTHADPEALESYGDYVYEIDLEAMKRDGYMPRVEREPGANNSEYVQALAHKIGMRDFHYSSDDPAADDDATVIIHGHIPPKYLKPFGN